METSKLIYRAEGHDLVRPAADDYFVICRNARVNKCLCCQADV